MKPAASVILPVRNQVHRLRLTLATLEQQAGVSSDEYEVIVVDDRSTDRCAEVIESIARSAPYRLIYAHSNSAGCRGVPRNLGASFASGEVLIFLDADACASRQFVFRHLQAHATRDRVMLGDVFVIPHTEYLLDPGAGIPFPDVQTSVHPFKLDIDRLREQSDAVLMPLARKGAYPNLEVWHAQVEDMLDAEDCSFAWVGVIPHNLSMSREMFVTIDGFDNFMQHAEGWDLGIRARNAGCTLGWIQGAKSYHLYHRRSKSGLRQTSMQGQKSLLQRYPGGEVEAALLWSASQLGDTMIPYELNLNNWRVVQQLYNDACSREELVQFHQLYETTTTPLMTMDYLSGMAVNPTFAGRPESSQADRVRVRKT